MEAKSQQRICLTCPILTNYWSGGTLNDARFFKDAQTLGIEVNDGRRMGKPVVLTLPPGAREDYAEGKQVYKDEHGRPILSTKVDYDDHVTFADIEILQKKG